MGLWQTLTSYVSALLGADPASAPPPVVAAGTVHRLVLSAHNAADPTPLVCATMVAEWGATSDPAAPVSVRTRVTVSGALVSDASTDYATLPTVDQARSELAAIHAEALAEARGGGAGGGGGG